MIFEYGLSPLKCNKYWYDFWSKSETTFKKTLQKCYFKEGKAFLESTISQQRGSMEMSRKEIDLILKTIGLEGPKQLE